MQAVRIMVYVFQLGDQTIFSNKFGEPTSPVGVRLLEASANKTRGSCPKTQGTVSQHDVVLSTKRANRENNNGSSQLEVGVFIFTYSGVEKARGDQRADEEDDDEGEENVGFSW